MFRTTQRLHASAQSRESTDPVFGAGLYESVSSQQYRSYDSDWIRIAYQTGRAGLVVLPCRSFSRSFGHLVLRKTKKLGRPRHASAYGTARHGVLGGIALFGTCLLLVARAFAVPSGTRCVRERFRGAGLIRSRRDPSTGLAGSQTALSSRIARTGHGHLDRHIALRVPAPSGRVPREAGGLPQSVEACGYSAESIIVSNAPDKSERRTLRAALGSSWWRDHSKLIVVPVRPCMRPGTALCGSRTVCSLLLERR